ncbi:MAG TPA: DHA2 family efflux MFS transporter permease subunit [Kofleriaceae bacterium]|nr:DHA2 family efflux MFS transporter permease subunit [Kofleriaceae bacterium]
MTATSLPVTSAPPQVNKWLVAVSIAFGSLMATIDSSIVNVALPNIRGELGASIQEITWISTAYMIAMVLVMPLTGFLGGFFGQKRVYLISMVVFVAGSALCGTARSLTTLVFYRILQGLGGGALQPSQQAILRQTFPPHEQGMAMAIFSMVIMVGPAIGPVLGGYITDNYSWPWIFYINLPVGAIGILMTMQNVHEPDDVRAANRARAELARKNLDIAGIVLMVIGIGALQYLFEEGPQDDWFDSMQIRIAMFVCCVALIGFIIRELTATAPVVNLRLFKDPTFASATFVAFIMFGMLMGSMFLLPVFCQESLHYTATLSGVVLMPRTLAMMAVSPIVGRLYNRVQPGFIVGFGVLLFAIGSYQLSHITLDTSSTDMIVPLVITGGAFACLFVPLTTAALSKVERHLMADAAGLNSFIRQVGGSIGLTIFATMFTNYALEANSALSAHLTVLRPEVVGHLSRMVHMMVSHGANPAAAQAFAMRITGGRMFAQATVLSFDRVFLLQGILFFGVLPLLFLIRVPRHAAPAHVEMPAE